MNLDTAERVVFGHDEDSSVTISEAVQASTALPGFYKPARIKGVDYVDGGVRRTANIDVAIEHGARARHLLQPVPAVLQPRDPAPRPRDGRVRLRRRSRWPRAACSRVLNQVFRTLLHSRLQYGLREYQDDPNFRGDIIVIEPKESDVSFFRMNPLAFWERRVAAEHGYVSVTQSIERQFDRVRQILESYGIQLTRRETRERLEQIKASKVEPIAFERSVRGRAEEKRHRRLILIFGAASTRRFDVGLDGVVALGAGIVGRAGRERAELPGFRPLHFRAPRLGRVQRSLQRPPHADRPSRVPWNGRAARAAACRAGGSGGLFEPNARVSVSRSL